MKKIVVYFAKISFEKRGSGGTSVIIFWAFRIIAQLKFNHYQQQARCFSNFDKILPLKMNLIAQP